MSSSSDPPQVHRHEGLATADACDVADDSCRQADNDGDETAARCDSAKATIAPEADTTQEDTLQQQQQQQHLSQIEVAAVQMDGMATIVTSDQEVRRSGYPGHGCVRPASATVRNSDVAVPKDVVTSLPTRRIASSQQGDVEDGGKTGDGLLKTRQFKKAKSAATFMLDGVSYTIVASPPPTPKASHDVTAPTASVAAATTGSQRASGAAGATSGGGGETLHKHGSVTVLRRTMSGGQSTAKRAAAPSAAMMSALCALAASSNAETSTGSTLTSNTGDTPTGTCSSLSVDQVPGPQMCCQRLRDLLHKVEHDDIRRDELKSSLEYVVAILDAVFVDDTKTGFEADDEDDELSKVEADAVPTEVRDWLAQTFTRSTAAGGATKRTAGDNKPKFRSVANAIRAGILVDRIYRRISAPAGLLVPPSVTVLLKNIDSWSFDAFAVNTASDGNALKYVGYDLLQRYDLIAKFKIGIPVLESFLFRLQQGYSKFGNPYHNLVHAADVTQTMHYVISRSGLSSWLTDVELFAAIVAALIHDFEHTGTTNTFHVNTRSDVALLYNDKAVLENHHVSAAFRLLKEDEYNIIGGLKAEEFREFRSLVIDVVLATDMSYHFQQIKNMKSHLSTPDSIDKTKALSLIVHCADISHPSKPWDLHHRWTELLIQEFFRQGDREESLGLPISPLCDRKNTLVAESQIGFIDFIVDPTMQVMGDMVEKMVESLHQQQRDAAAAAAVAPSGGDDVTSNNTTNGAETVSAPTTKPPVSRLTSQTSIQSSNNSDGEPKRPWENCLVINKQMWKDRAARGWISPLQEPRVNDAASDDKTSSTERSSNPEQQQDHGAGSTVDDQADSGVESPGLKGVQSPMPSNDDAASVLWSGDGCHGDQTPTLSNGPVEVASDRPGSSGNRVDSVPVVPPKPTRCQGDVTLAAQTSSPSTTLPATSGLRQSKV